MTADVGATKTRVGIFDPKGMRLLIRTVLRTPQEGDENVVAKAIIDAAEALMKTLGLHEVMAIGVGSIGPLDIRRGSVVNSPNIPLKNFSIRTPLMKHFNKPTYVVNDCVAAVYAEFMAGAGAGKRNVVYITISSGIGGGVIVDGHVLLGKDGNAHEIGHLAISYDSDIKCGCGGIGHWEALASGGNVWKLVKQLRIKWHGDSELYRLSASEVITAETLFRYWRDGDGFASYVVNELARINAAGIASVINAYDPEMISFGGSVVLNNPELLKLSLNLVNQYATNRAPEYAITSFGDEVVIYGAAWIAVNPPEELIKIQR